MKMGLAAADETMSEAKQCIVQPQMDEYLKQAKHRRRNIDEGWAWVILAVAFVGFAITSGLFYTFSLYFSVFLEEFVESRSYTAWVGSLNSAVFQLSGPIGSALIIRFGCRTAIISGGLICALGFGLSSLCKSILHLLFTYGLIIAIGYNFVYSGIIVALGLYFERRHAMAVGLSMAGSGVGILVFGPSIQQFIMMYGWRGSLVINAGFSLQYCVLGALVFPLKSKASKTVKKEIAENMMGSLSSLGASTKKLERNIFKDPTFWCLNLSGFFWIMGGLTVFVISKDFAVSRGLGEQYTLALMATGIGDIFGRLTGGFVASRSSISTVCYYSIAMVACSIVMLTFMLVHTASGLIVVFGFFGFSYGQQSVLLPIIPTTLYGSEKLAVTFGFILFTAGIGTLVGPPLAGLIVDKTHSYDGAFCFAGVCNFLAAICTFIVYVSDRNYRLNVQPLILNSPSHLKANHVKGAGKLWSNTIISQSATAAIERQLSEAVLDPDRGEVLEKLISNGEFGSNCVKVTLVTASEPSVTNLKSCLTVTELDSTSILVKI